MKMKIIEKNGFFHVGSNAWTLKEDAEKYAHTLINCNGCLDCHNLIGCRLCIACANCIHCISCEECNSSVGLIGANNHSYEVHERVSGAKGCR